MIETLMWIVLALAGSVFFFRILEGWADIGNRIHDETEPTETDEWPH